MCSKNILSCIHSDIPIWHSYLDFIWHSFGHSINSIWHSFWHSIWHVFWHTFWHLFWHFFWHLFGSRRGPQHPELAIWLRSIGAHATDEMAKEETRRRGGKKKRKELHLCQNLETLTCQVGKNKSDATLQQEVITAHQPFLRSKPNSLLWQYHQEATSVSAAPATPIRALAESFSLTFLKHTLRSPAGCSPALISVQSFPFPETFMSFQLLVLTRTPWRNHPKSLKMDFNGKPENCVNRFWWYDVWYASSCIP